MSTETPNMGPIQQDRPLKNHLNQQKHQALRIPHSPMSQISKHARAFALTILGRWTSPSVFMVDTTSLLCQFVTCSLSEPSYPRRGATSKESFQLDGDEDFSKVSRYSLPRQA